MVPKIFILLALISLAIAKETIQAKSQIVEANHFFSETNKQKTYTIDELTKGRPLVVLIKPVSDEKYTNTITLTVSSGNNKKQCEFKSYQDLCILESTGEKTGTLQIKCNELPCEASWKIYQPEINELKNSTSVANLYKVPKDADRLMIKLSCKKIQKTQEMGSKFALAFSDVKFRTLKLSELSLYIIFDEVKQGYLYLFVSSAFRSCVSMKVVKGQRVINSDLMQDILKKGQNTYLLNDLPNSKDFRFDVGMHRISQVNTNKQMKLAITGAKNDKRQNLREIVMNLTQSNTHFDFNFVVPKIDTEKYKDVKLEINTEDTMTFIQILMQKSQFIEVQATESSHFQLKKGQKINYKLIEQPTAEQKQQVSITVSPANKLEVSESKCSIQKGCQFSVEALEDVQGNIYIGVGNGDIAATEKQVVILQLKDKNSFTHKIKQLESLYIHKKLQLKKAVQVIINSPNVLIYVSNTKKCKIPSETCYQKIGNINRHFIYEPQTQEQTDIVFLVKALDNCEFTLTLIEQDSEYINLKDSQPFVYLFDSLQKNLKFKFKRSQKKDVNFNLVGPLHALDLIVQNGKKLPDDQQATISTQGYLQFKAENTPKDEFTILVRKRQDYKNKYVHFTLIASTKGKQIRLQSGITHYETLTKLQQDQKNNAEYIFQFNPDEEYILNFFSYNTKQQQVNIQMILKALSQDQDPTKQPKITKLVIDKSSDVLELSQVSAQLCAGVDDDDNCEISMQLKNVMDLQIDIAITLMQRHMILQLKQGLWQSYSLNQIAKTAHFYFLPRHIQNDVSLMFKTTDPSIRLKYRLFYANDDQIDPSQWPFPSQSLTAQEQQQQKQYKPITHFSISKGALTKCWPDCALLVSIIDLQHSESEGSFSVMASNSMVELPEKQKIDITLKEGETKSYLVDLKYALDKKQDLYFYVYHSIGITSIFANVYSQKLDRIPEPQQYDFSLNSKSEVKIQISKIIEIIKKMQMDEHLNLYLYIVVEGLSDSKLSIEYALNQINEPNQKLMSIDSLEHLALQSKSSKIYYAALDQQFQVKISRQNGFPFYTAKTCKKQLQKCLEQFRSSTQKGQQLLTKVAAYTATPCSQCFYLFRINTEEDPCSLNIHLQSKSSEVELTQNKGVYDFTQKNQSNKYVLYAIKGQDIYVNVHISEGEVDVAITDLGTIKQTKSGKNLIGFKIPGKSTEVNALAPNKKKGKQTEQQLNEQKKSAESIQYLRKKNPIATQALMSAFGLSDRFIQLHITVKSANPQKPTIYTISYSSGDMQFQLQDGLISDFYLQPKKQSVFYYSSRTSGHAYLTVSMQKSSQLKQLQISFKYCEPKNNIIDDDCWIVYSTQKPPIKQKTPHPTMMYSLIQKNYFAIALTSSGEHSQKVTLGINHQQIMILPFEKQFPFILHKSESISFLVQLSNPGYIQIITRKCDESNPTFSYTFDYDSFQKDQFTYQAELSTNPKNRFISKIKGDSTLYMRMKTSDEEQSMLSILVRYSEQKIRDADIYPGNKGNVQYTIVDSSNAQLTIKPPTCDQCSQKNNKFKYYLMSATKMRDLYSQLVCPSNFFSNLQFYSGEPITQEQVTPRSNADGTLTFSIKLLDQISYVGIKVSNNKGKQIFYKPIEVATLWGQLSRTSHGHKLAISSVFVCVVLAIVVCVRRSAKKGYKPIKDQI